MGIVRVDKDIRSLSKSVDIPSIQEYLSPKAKYQIEQKQLVLDPRYVTKPFSPKANEEMKEAKVTALPTEVKIPSLKPI